MSETADYNPGVWKGHDFKSARRSYDSHVGRSYGDAKKANIKAKDLVPTSITTESVSPLIVLCDVTASMGDWPATIFSKLPYFEHEGKEYLGEDLEICWGAIGDANGYCGGDQYPLQMRNFTKGTQLKEELEKLIIEGGGGGQRREMYEMAALYCLENVKMPNAISPILIIIGDEGFYEMISKNEARDLAKVDIAKNRISASEVFQKLKEKFSVYIIRKPYNALKGDELSREDKAITKQWEDALGADHVMMLPSADRVVDVMFGIFAKETNRIDYFKEELNDRQLPDKDGAAKVATVMKALETVHLDPGEPKKQLGSGKSVMVRKKGDAVKKTKSLI